MNAYGCNLKSERGELMLYNSSSQYVMHYSMLYFFNLHTVLYYSYYYYIVFMRSRNTITVISV